MSLICRIFGHRFDSVSGVHVTNRHVSRASKLWKSTPCYHITLHCVRCGHMRRQYIKKPTRWNTAKPQRWYHGHNSTRPKRKQY